MQTWLVHMRQPVKLWRDLGPLGFITSQALLLGVIISALFHPLFLGLTFWSLLTGNLFPATAGWLTSILVGASLAVLVAGYATAIFASALGLRKLGKPHWWATLATMPVYWLLISAASWMALWQLIVKPFHWNKTEHGLSKTLRAPARPKPRLRTKPRPSPPRAS
jgi:hypothetical protein